MKQATTPQKDVVNALCGLLATLRATHWNHLTTHWQCSGETFYSDHKLFKKLYTSLENEIDTLAEKTVCYFNSSSVNSNDQIDRVYAILSKKELQQLDPISRAILFEKMVQSDLAVCFKILSASNSLTLGLDDFIAATANNHETNLYLLTQRAVNSRG